MKFFPNFSTFVEIGSFSIQWYAIMILIGAAIAYKIGEYRFKKLDYSTDLLSDYFFNLLFIGIIGARLWEVIFTWERFASNPMEIFMIWNGGLAIHGGIFTGLIYSYYFFKKHEIPFLKVGDVIMPCVLIAQACGRWGNFFNHECYGSEVSLEFLQSLHLPQFIIDHMYIGGAYHHPTFLYEGIGNVICFLIIVFLVRKVQKHEGVQFYCYFIAYGVVRYLVESIRMDSFMVGALRVPQLVSIVFILVGITGIVYQHYKGNKLDQRLP